MRRAQSWTVDYTLGMLLFLAALAVVSSSIGDVFDVRNYDSILRDANRLSEALASAGYPKQWDETDVVRGGLLYNDRLSWRKLGLLHQMNDAEMQQILPSAYNYAFTIADKNGNILPYDNECSFGKERLSKNPEAVDEYVPMAYYTKDGTGQLQAYMSSMSAVEYSGDELVSLLRDFHEYGVVVFEDPYFNNTLNTTMTATLLREEFRSAAEYGPVVVMTGMLGTPVFGVNTTLASSNGTIQAHNDSLFELDEDAEVNFTKVYSLSFMPKEGGILGNLDGSLHQQIIANPDSIAAMWQYEDSIVYYFSDTEGLYDGDPLRPVLQQGLTNAAHRASINCTVDPASVVADHLVRIDRLVAGRGELYTLSLYVWGDS